MKTQAIITAAITSCFALLACGAYAQGSLTPPGAPAETMKTLEQVEPRIDLATVTGDGIYHHIISQPGSYYLSGNLTVTKTSGIHITAAGVTLDLNGFEISRASGSAGEGIATAIGMDRATIRNGTVVGFDIGIYTRYTAGSLLEKLAVSGSAHYGIFAGSSSRIVDCRAQHNPGTGIDADNGSSLAGCITRNNQGDYGIYAENGSSLTDCTAYNNEGNGIYAYQGSSLARCTAYNNQGDYGIFANIGASLANCSARKNSGTGIYAGWGSTLQNCAAHNNQGIYGIYAGDGSSLLNCTADDNQGDYGIFAGDGSSLLNCTASYNHGIHGIRAGSRSSLQNCAATDNEGTGSFSYGIRAGSGSTIVGCTVSENSNTNSSGSSDQGVGIYAGGSSKVKDCNAWYNEGDGIRVGGGCTVSGNSSIFNGGFPGDGAGIHATAGGNRIEGNNVLNNDRGIDVDLSGNIVVRNSASGNGTNYDIAAGNQVGTIQTSMPAVGGPWDNFEF